MDGDQVRHRPRGPYNGVSEGLGEGQPLNRLAKRAGALIASDIRRLGDEPLRILDKAGELLIDVKNLDRIDASYQIDDCARSLSGHRRGIPLALEASKEVLIGFNGNMRREDLVFNLACQYVWRVYDAYLGEALPLDAAYTTCDPTYIAARAAELKPYMEIYIHSIARHIVEQGSVKSLRKLQVRESDPSIMNDLNGSDLLSL